MVFVAGAFMAVPSIIGVWHQIRMDAKAEERAAKAEEARALLQTAVTEIGVKTDGMSHALVAATQISAQAEGAKQERDRAALEKASNDAAVAKAKE